MEGNAPGAGFQYAAKDLAWSRKDVLLFANSVGCTAEELQFVYEMHPHFGMLPTFPIILSNGAFEKLVDDVPDFHSNHSVDTRRAVDGQRLIQIIRPLPASNDGNFSLHQKILGVYDKGTPGTVVETEYLIVSKDTGEVHVRMVGSEFFVGQGNWGGPRGPTPQLYPIPTGKVPDVRSEIATTRETPLLYRLNGDYNPLHATLEPGRELGYEGAILHGLFIWNTTAHVLLKELGGNVASNLGEFQARFKAAAKPGQVLIVEAWRMGDVHGEGWREVRFVTKLKDGKVVLDNGRALLKCTLEDSKL